MRGERHSENSNGCNAGKSTVMGLFDRLKKPRQPDVAARVEAELDEVAAKLGPFPDTFSYHFEPELLCATPRPIPPSFKQGGQARNYRSAMIALFLFGALSLFFSCLSWTERVSYYILPLAYLDWVGKKYKKFFRLGIQVGADKTIDPSPALCKIAWENATKGPTKGNDE